MQKALFIKAKRDLDLFYQESQKHSGWLPKDKYLVKALRFQGFVPKSEYKLKDKFAYIMTSRMLENEYWVYPMKLADNYYTLQKGKYQFYQHLYGKVGIPGITKINYSK